MSPHLQAEQDRFFMPNNNSNSGPEPDQADSLSATAMFLKAFEVDTKKAADPLPIDTATPPSPRQVSAAPERVPAAPASAPASASGTAPGEFTQMFNSLNPRPAAPPPPKPAPPQVATQVVKGPPPSPSNQGQGEFTKIFVSGVTPAYTPPARPSEETPRPAPPSSGPSGSKGFSTPGVSGSASGEGGFTQFFSNAPRPPAPVQTPAPSPPRQSAAPPPSDDPWKNDPFFRPAEKASAPEAVSPSVTSMLSSLAGSGAGTSAPKQAEPAPYRPEPLPAASYAPTKSAEEAGGVTRLIQRLSQQPAAPVVPASSAPPALPVDPGPGEFTRIMYGVGSRPPAPPPPAQQAFVVPPVPAPPSIPKVAPPPMPGPMPHAAAAPPAPVFAAPPVPAIPKPAPPPMPALAPPKSKLEAMVPILLVINTFLLVLLLVVVIFLIKAR
jgi:hypothetical protein